MADMRTLFYKGNEDTEWRPVSLHAVDAAHALEIDSEHWKAEIPVAPEPVAEPTAEPAADMDDDGDADLGDASDDASETDQ